MRIFKYQFGAVQLSMLIIFIAASICAVYYAFVRMRPEYPMPFSALLIIYEGYALLATLVYGIAAHFILAIIHKIKS